MSTSGNRYPASLGRCDGCRSDVDRTPCMQGPGRLNKGRSSSQDIIDQQAGDPADTGSPSRLHLHRMFQVAGSLPVVEPGLIGNPAPKHQRRRDDQLALGASCQCNGGTGHQFQRRIPAPADGREGGRNRHDEHRPVAGRQN